MRTKELAFSLSIHSDFVSCRVRVYAWPLQCKLKLMCFSICM